MVVHVYILGNLLWCHNNRHFTYMPHVQVAYTIDVIHFYVGGMAVDWVRNKLFYSDKTNNAIYVYDVATNTRQVFVSGGISDLRDVAVDPLNG